MFELFLLLGGVLFGLLMTIYLVRKMMVNPHARIWLSDWVNWSDVELPEDCYQMVRHGKWIATTMAEKDQ